MANEQVIRKNIKNVLSTTDAEIIKQRFQNSLNAVNNLFQNKPSVYATWIRFQIGVSDPIIFDSTSTSMSENLISTLTYKQNGTGTANTFSIIIQYDPFKTGQDPTGTLEQLDYLVAQALEVDYDSDLDRFRGYFQFGYSGTDSDTNLISPLMEFYLTSANSSTSFSTGITTYTFEGTSYAGIYCDVTANIGQMNNWRLVDIITWHLYLYFGNIEYQPHGYDGQTPPKSYAAGYAIDIPDEYYEDGNTVVIPEVGAKSNVSVWQFCMDLLQQYPLTQSEIDSGNYDNFESMDTRKRPRNVMYITDEGNKKTIHVRHIVPMETEESDMINYTFTWGDQKTNIIKEWTPQVDLTTYLIRKCELEAKKKTIEESMSEELQQLDQDRGSFKDKVIFGVGVSDPTGSNSSQRLIYQSAEDQYNKKREEIINKWYDEMLDLTQEPQELYNASITLQGIPVDAPLAVGIKVVPKVLESTSRTAGYYYITTCETKISSKGLFTTTLGLFRMRGLNEQTFTSSKILAAKKESEKSQYTNSSNSSNAITSTTVPQGYDEDTTSSMEIPYYRRDPIKNPTESLFGGLNLSIKQ